MTIRRPAKGIILMLLALAALLASGCTEKPSETAVTPKTVRTMTAEMTHSPQLMAYIGVVDADTTVALGFKNGGTVSAVAVTKGDTVHRGDLLASIDPADTGLYAASAAAQQQAQSAVVQKAEAALAYSEKQWARIETLQQAGAASDSDADAARLELQVRREEVLAARKALAQTEAQAGLAQNALADTRLLSPVDGIVADTLAEVGEMTGSGTPVVVIRSPQQLVRISVSQKDLPEITKGMQAHIVVDGISCEGTVTSIAEVPNPETRTYPVEVSATEGTFPLGAVARVQLVGKEQTGVKVPIEAIQINDASFVYVVVDGKAVRREVTTLETSGTQVFVSGIDAGSQVVVEGMKRLQNGDPVQLKGGQ